jgi:hypothetical protein
MKIILVNKITIIKHKVKNFLKEIRAFIILQNFNNNQIHNYNLIKY